jgi:MarR family 2-MHQ and catechol resistance regulon transcriptional repressor
MDTAPHIRLVLWKAAKAVEAVDRASIAGTGLHVSDFTILEALLHKGPLPINTIGEKVLLTSGSMTAAVNRLEKRELVKRVQDPADGRCFQVHLTPAGRQAIEAAFATHSANLEQMVEALSAGERQELLRLLKKVGRTAEALMAR